MTARLRRRRPASGPVAVLQCSRCRKVQPCYRVPQIRGLKLCMRCLYWIKAQTGVGLYQLACAAGR
jgi:hypothetical protein